MGSSADRQDCISQQKDKNLAWLNHAKALIERGYLLMENSEELNLISVIDKLKSLNILDNKNDNTLYSYSEIHRVLTKKPSPSAVQEAKRIFNDSPHLLDIKLKSSPLIRAIERLICNLVLTRSLLADASPINYTRALALLNISQQAVELPDDEFYLPSVSILNDEKLDYKHRSNSKKATIIEEKIGLADMQIGNIKKAIKPKKRKENSFYNKELSHARKILDSSLLEPINSYIYNNLIAIYNFLFTQLKNSNPEEVTKFSAQTPIDILEFEDVKCDEALIHRISLIDNYEALNKSYRSKFFHVDEKTTHAKTYDDVHRMAENHSDHIYALTGLALIEEQTKLKSTINLMNVLALVWQFIPRDCIVAKNALCNSLATIGREIGTLKATQRIEHTIEALLSSLNTIPEISLNIINKPDELYTLIEKRCNEQIKGYLSNAAAEEQIKILRHLEKKEDSIKNHLTFTAYVDEATIKLKKEFSSYKIICKDIDDRIQNNIENSIKEVSSSWLKRQTKHNIDIKLEHIKHPDLLKAALLQAFSVQIQSSDNKGRELLLKSLQERLEKIPNSINGVIIKNDANEIEQIYKRYKEILLMDEYHQELQAIIEAQEKTENKFLYLELKEKAKQLLQKFSYKNMTRQDIYKKPSNEGSWLKQSIEPKKINPAGKPWVLYHTEMPLLVSQFKYMTDQIKKEKQALDHKLFEEQKKEANIFKPNYLFPQSYAELGHQKLSEKVSAIFKDYADKAHWYYFHAFRHHTEEARLIEKDITKLNTPEEVRDFLLSKKNALMAKREFNLEGSFSRRIHYCLDVLIPKALSESPQSQNSQRSQLNLVRS